MKNSKNPSGSTKPIMRSAKVALRGTVPHSNASKSRASRSSVGRATGVDENDSTFSAAHRDEPTDSFGRSEGQTPSQQSFGAGDVASGARAPRSAARGTVGAPRSGSSQRGSRGEGELDTRDELASTRVRGGDDGNPDDSSRSTASTRSADYHQGFYDGFHHGASHRSSNDRSDSGQSEIRRNNSSRSPQESGRDRGDQNYSSQGNHNLGGDAEGNRENPDYDSSHRRGSGQEQFGAEDRSARGGGNRASGNQYRSSGERFDGPSQPRNSDWGTQRSTSSSDSNSARGQNDSNSNRSRP